MQQEYTLHTRLLQFHSSHGTDTTEPFLDESLTDLRGGAVAGGRFELQVFGVFFCHMTTRNSA